MRREESEWYLAGYTRPWWKSLDTDQRLEFLAELTEEEMEEWFRDWRVWARDEQLLPDGIWSTALLHPGRGWGKTRCAVEYCNDEVYEGRKGRLAIIGQGEDDIRDVMIEGVSGFLATARPDNRPVFTPSTGSGRLTWPNGAIGIVVSALDPEALRGPEYDLAWFDEPMAVPAKKRQDTVTNLRMGLRLGRHPQLIYTTTPKPHAWIREEIAKGLKEAHKPIAERRYIIITGNTLDNSENLPEVFLEGIVEDYEGTNLGRQEMAGEVLGDEEGALWTPTMLDRGRVRDVPDDPEERLAFLVAFAATCDKVVVGVDPNLTTSAAKTAHAAGIVICARKGLERFVLDDWSTGGGPAKWSARAVAAYEQFDADEVVVETNQGGDMCKLVILAAAKEADVGDVVVRMVKATKGKQRRAEPVSSAYELGKVRHLGGVGDKKKPGPFYKLENQMCALHEGLDPTGEDFDRCDAAVWGLTRLARKKSSQSAGAGNLPAILTFGGING